MSDLHPKKPKMEGRKRWSSNFRISALETGEIDLTSNHFPGTCDRDFLEALENHTAQLFCLKEGVCFYGPFLQDQYQLQKMRYILL